MKSGEIFGQVLLIGKVWHSQKLNEAPLRQWRTMRVFTVYSLSGENYRAVDTSIRILVESNGEIC